jgi:DNA-binding transcriptional LysR family regulator
MSLRDLEIFHSIMRAGTLTGASRELGVSQPALSIALRHFEDRIGFQLFNRSGGRLHPTEEAQSIFADVDNIFERVRTVERALTNYSQANSGSVVVAVNAAFMGGEMPKVISNFRLDLPATKLVVHKLTSLQVVQRVAQRQADFGIAHAPIKDKTLVAEVLSRSNVICVVRKSDPLARQSSIHVSELRGRRIITYDSGTVIGEPIFGLFAAEGVELDQSVVINEANLASMLVEETGDVAIAIRTRNSESMFPNLAFIPLVPQIPVVAMLVTSPDRTLSRPARMLIASIRQTVRSD